MSSMFAIGQSSIYGKLTTHFSKDLCSRPQSPSTY